MILNTLFVENTKKRSARYYVFKYIYVLDPHVTTHEPRTFVSDAYVIYNSQCIVRAKHKTLLCKMLLRV